MKEEQSFNHRLQDVPEVVGTANMCEFVCQDNFQLFGAETCERADRQENQRTDNANREWASDAARKPQIYEPRYAHLQADSIKANAECVWGLLQRIVTKSSNYPPSPNCPDGKAEHTYEPEDIKIRHDVAGQQRCCFLGCSWHINHRQRTRDNLQSRFRSGNARAGQCRRL